MRSISLFFVAVLGLFNCLSCSESGLARSTESNSNSSASSGNSKEISATATSRGGTAIPPQPPNQSETRNPSEADSPNDFVLNDKELQEKIKNNLGSLIVATFYKPHFVEGDFNNDKLMDAAIVVGAEDRYGDADDIGDLFAGLPFTVEGINLQNLETNGILLAKPGQSAVDLEKHKSKLNPKSKLGLLIILSKSGDWKAELAKTNYDQKFILMDALFGSEVENKQDPVEWLSLVRRGENCLPSAVKGEGIFSGDAESAGKVIYFNGKTFGWTQCGD